MVQRQLRCASIPPKMSTKEYKKVLVLALKPPGALGIRRSSWMIFKPAPKYVDSALVSTPERAVASMYVQRVHNATMNTRTFAFLCNQISSYAHHPLDPLLGTELPNSQTLLRWVDPLDAQTAGGGQVAFWPCGVPMLASISPICQCLLAPRRLSGCVDPKGSLV